jgi:hypothetical protein
MKIEENNMKLFKYNQFKNSDLLLEDLNKAKKFLKDKYMIDTISKELGLVKGELKAQLDNNEIRMVSLKDFTPEEQKLIYSKFRDVNLTTDKIREIERDADFLKIREFLGDKYMKWTYHFTYFYFVEMYSFEELFTNDDSIFNKLLELSGVLDRLPKKFDVNFIDPKIGNNAEILIDGLAFLEDQRKAKAVYDQLPGPLKKDYKDSPQMIKDQFDKVAVAFIELGKKGDSEDQERHDKLWKAFFGEMRTIEADYVDQQGRKFKKGDKRYFGSLMRYKDIREFIKAAENYIKSSEKDGIVDFYNKITEVNDKYGIAQGVDVVYDNEGLLILDIKSFQSNRFLNGNTRHCIKDYIGTWDSYVTNTDNKQYYIYNFNIPQYDNLSIIGITIEPGQGIRAAHSKDDTGVKNTIKSLLKSWELEYELDDNLFSYLKPMSGEEVEKRRRSREADRNIIKKGLTIEQIKQYVMEDGANINKNNCDALLHAVDENDYEKAKVILELGGSPNLRPKQDSIVNRAKDIEMIKLLVTYGSELTGMVFNNISNDKNSVEFCFEQGLKVDFDNFLPFRRSCKGSWKSMDDIGEAYTEVIDVILKYGGPQSLDSERNMQLKWAAEYARFDIMDFLIKHGVTKGFKVAKRWVSHSRKLNDKHKEGVLKYLDDKIAKYES